VATLHRSATKDRRVEDRCGGGTCNKSVGIGTGASDVSGVGDADTTAQMLVRLYTAHMARREATSTQRKVKLAPLVPAALKAGAGAGVEATSNSAESDVGTSSPAAVYLADTDVCWSCASCTCTEVLFCSQGF
jgi:hypothetical protein